MLQAPVNSLLLYCLGQHGLLADPPAPKPIFLQLPLDGPGVEVLQLDLRRKGPLLERLTIVLPVVPHKHHHLVHLTLSHLLLKAMPGLSLAPEGPMVAQFCYSLLMEALCTPILLAISLIVFLAANNPKAKALCS